MNHHLVTAWLADQAKRGVLPRSVRQRRILMDCFCRWLGTRTLDSVTKDDVERFLDSRGTLAAKTRHSWLSHLHVYFEWAMLNGYGTADPTAAIPRPRLRRSLPRPASTAELEKAMAQATPQVRCWIVLAAYQGLRCQEIAGLSVEDVLVAENLLRVVHGKGAMERLLPLHSAVLESLRALPMPRYGWVFRMPSDPTKPRPPHNLAQRFNQKLAELGVNATPHQLRHWFGSNLYAQTHDLRLVQEMLGHQSPATTAVYTAFTRVKAGRAVGQLKFAAPRQAVTA